ncbi:MAG: NAD-dependent epimerase/dehydratase family protein [Chloroflexi bacterium]|nr:NAD-dependent epimerase/dehydratase family protein [Chloroflexota bacterium]
MTDKKKNYWQGKRVLVTGAGGFIASHLVEILVKLGVSVRAFVRYNSRGDPGLLVMLPQDIYSQVEVVAGDLRDLPAVQMAVRDVSYIFHLGALIAIPYSYVHPAEVVETNVMGTLNVLLAARNAGTKRVVHTSTSEVYGTAQYVPIDEAHPLRGQSPYSASKIGADKLAESFFLSFDLPVVTLRPFNTYGPRQSARAVIPTIITQALSQKVIRLGNLDARRDLTFVSDTVRGFLNVGEVPGLEGETINLGTGIEVIIGDIAQKVIELVGKTVKIVIDPNRIRPEKSEVQRLLSDNKLARERLNWNPEVGLDDGLKRTIVWIENHLDYYQTNEYQI